MLFLKNSLHIEREINPWDFLVIFIVFSIFGLLAWSAQNMLTPFYLGEPLEISLQPAALPVYALRTVLRMMLALLLSFTFTFSVGALAAKYRHFERIILPFIDVMQSVPVLGFLSITVVGFIHLFPGSILGPECAAIFAIFTSQAWNMFLAFYQSLKTIPLELKDAGRIFQLSAWQQFWRIEVPYALPGLIWNAMVSMSAGWFFVVASEAISVDNHIIHLPGIGSYIAVAIEQANTDAIFFAVCAMLIVILIYDQLIFRPILKWSARFNDANAEGEEESNSWLLDVLDRTRVIKIASKKIRQLLKYVFLPNFKLAPIAQKISKTTKNKIAHTFIQAWNFFCFVTVVLSVLFAYRFITQHIAFSEIRHVFYLGAITACKVAVLIILSSLLWVPVGVYVGLRPKLSAWFQPVIQFLAAFPANLVYPFLVMLIVKYKLNIEIWTAPLMILGTQWYILSNVISGTSRFPRDMDYVAKNFGVKGFLKWRRFLLPAIFPHYITGAMAAAGGAWNASIIADVVEWGNIKLMATGLGGYIQQVTTEGDYPRIALSLSIMCLYVITINHLVWKPLYNQASRFEV